MDANLSSISQASAAPSERTKVDRRRFLRGSALLAGGSTLALTFGGLTAPTASADDFTDDIDVLNYALTLEHLEYAFYRDGLARFTMTDFTSARFIRGFGGRIISNVYGYFELIREHEEAHVDAITAVILSLGGDPVEEACYDFGYEDVDGFVQVAQALENTGVSAYTGAVHAITNKDILEAAATIATVEARHASYLNLLNRAIPFPDAFDDPKTREEILAIAGGFIVPCE